MIRYERFQDWWTTLVKSAGKLGIFPRDVRLFIPVSTLKRPPEFITAEQSSRSKGGAWGMAPRRTTLIQYYFDKLFNCNGL
jgi:hypothetical protein